LGRQLGALCNVPHGLTSCVTLPAAIEFNLEAAEERLRTLGQSFGLPVNDSVQVVADRIRDLIRSLGLPVRLRDVGVERDRLASVAEAAMRDAAIRTNPRAITSAAEIEELLKAAW
jgi:alcohol dehydrogenase class IV